MSESTAAGNFFPGVAFAHVVSLGANCEVAHQLRLNGRYSLRAPFDWLVTPLDALAPIFSESGARLGSTFVAAQDGTSVRCGAYDVLYHHEFPRAAGHLVRFDAEAVAACRAKMAHKWSSLVRACASGSPVLFLRCWAETDLAWDRLGPGKDKLRAVDLNTLVGTLAQRFPELDFRLLLLLPTSGETSDLTEPPDPRVAVESIARAKNGDWAVTDADWRGIFARLQFRAAPVATALGETLHWSGEQEPANNSVLEPIVSLRPASAGEPLQSHLSARLIRQQIERDDIEKALIDLADAIADRCEPPDLAVEIGRDLWVRHRSFEAAKAFAIAFDAGLRDPDFLRDHLGLLTGETRYAEVIEAGRAVEPFDDGMRSQRIMLTGHARLALAYEPKTTIAQAVARECALSWLSTDALLARICEHVADKRPFALVRIGDGEARFLIATRPEMRVIISPTEAAAIGTVIWNNWFGEPIEATSEADRLDLLRAYEQAVARADVIGTCTADRLRRDTGHYGYLAAQDAWLSTLPRDRSEQCYTDALVPRSLDRLTPFLARVFRGCDFVGAISPHPGLAAALASRFSISEYVDHVVPAEGRLPTAAETRARGRHFPDRYRDLIASLRVPRPGAVFLVAAGLLGKIYCGRIRELGGIALDIGALADAWMGYDTRDGQLREVAALKNAPPVSQTEARTLACLSMQKTGSTALVAALSEAGFSGVLHGHFAGPQSLVMRERHRLRPASQPAPPSPGATLAARFADPSCSFTIVTCLRDPIAQIISTYFQRMSIQRSEHGVEIPLTHEAFVAWVDQVLPAHYPTWWFDDNLRTTLGFDFRCHSFDRERRSMRFSSERLRLLILRQEDPAPLKEAELGWLMGCDRIALPRANVTAEKAEGTAYADFLASFVAPARWIDDLHHNDAIRHFYTPEEREHFRLRWSGSKA